MEINLSQIVKPQEIEDMRLYYFWLFDELEIEYDLNVFDNAYTDKKTISIRFDIQKAIDSIQSIKRKRIGRPRADIPSYDELINLKNEGYSITDISEIYGVCRKTIYNHLNKR